MKSPIETKVIAATAGSGAGAVASSFLVWLLGVTFWHASADSGHVSQAISAVPGPVSSVIHVAVSFAGAFAGGWLAPHTSRHVVPTFNVVSGPVSPANATVMLDEPTTPARQVMLPNDSGPDLPGAIDVPVQSTAVTGVGA